MSNFLLAVAKILQCLSIYKILLFPKLHCSQRVSRFSTTVSPSLLHGVTWSTCNIIVGSFAGERPHFLQEKLSRFNTIQRSRRFIPLDVRFIFIFFSFCCKPVVFISLSSTTCDVFTSSIISFSLSEFTYSINFSKAAFHEPNLLA